MNPCLFTASFLIWIREYKWGWRQMACWVKAGFV